jgi:hypothetical protein
MANGDRPSRKQGLPFQTEAAVPGCLLVTVPTPTARSLAVGPRQWDTYPAGRYPRTEVNNRRNAMDRSGPRAARRCFVLVLASSLVVSAAAVAFATSAESSTRSMTPSAGIASAPEARPVSWIRLSPTASPPARTGQAMAFDPAINKMVVFGGTAGREYFPDTWTYDGTTWTEQSPAVSPSARTGALMAYDPTLGKIVLYGGYNNDTSDPDSITPGVYADTWTYDGTTWTQQSPAVSPPALSGASMAFDPRTGNLVLFGGERAGGLPTETWTYNGATWARQSPAASPPARYNAAMAYDPVSGNVVLFGGASGIDRPCKAAQFDDTWTYDGSTWTRESPSTSPPGRSLAVMADDPATGQLILFGGNAQRYTGFGCLGFENFNDTWTYSGGTWSQLAPSISPSMRATSAMAYDEQTSQMILFGGGTLTGGVRRNDTWAYQAVGSGYRFVAADGGVFAFAAPFRGSTGNIRLNQPIVGMAANPGTGGYWLVAKDGGIFAFDTPYFGSAGDSPLAQPIVGIAAAPDGQGYWIVGADGSIFNYGPGAHRDGAKHGPLQLNRPIVGIAADPITHGYRLVASDGGIFAFGAPFLGSTGNLHLNQPIVGIASDPATGGYWLVARDGGVFAFNAPFYGSTGNMHLNQPIVGMTAAPDGQGYWLVARDGGIFSFGPGATFHGSTGNLHLNQPIVGMTGS